MSFVHSRVHSSYSVGRGASDLKALFKRAADLGQPALALTDDAALHGAYKAVKYAQEFGVQPIIGAKLYVPADKAHKRKGSFLVYSQSEDGYANICRMLRALLDPSRLGRVGMLDGDILRAMKQSQDGNDSWTRDVVVAIGVGGDAVCNAMMDNPDFGAGRTTRFLEHVMGMFPRAFLEVCRTGYETEVEVGQETVVVDWALANGIPLLATTPVWYAEPKRHDAWAIVNAITDGRAEPLQGGEAGLEHASPYRPYLRDRAEMDALFADLPAAVENTLALAQVAPYWPSKRKPMLPRFESGTGLSEAEELRRQSREGLEARLDHMGAADGIRASYRERLDFELGVIERMKFPGYFLIVSDFIKWAKSQDIPVGPGRGSGAGSLVAYSLVITDVDPIPFGLLFERFLNPDRVSMPDFDIDFCEDRREEVIGYVQRRYGADRVARIQTFTEYKPKSALKDVGRIVSHSDAGKLTQNRLNQLTSVFPAARQGKEATMAEVRVVDVIAEAISADARVALAFDKAADVQGLYKTSSTHAAGIVIGGESLDRHIPVGFDEHHNLAVQYDMKDTEEVGLVKFDFLGLTTLTIIRWALRHALELEGSVVDFGKMGFDDAPTLKLFAEGRTTGIFQFESDGMKKALANVRADRIEDLIAVNALYRPGPMEMIPVYADCKHGLAMPDYPEPSAKTKPYLQETYGVMVYQEQIIQIAQSVAGMSLGKADLLRRAIGKKNKVEMAEQKVFFIQGAVENGATERQAQDLFALIEKFADYGFNKSHAAAYSVIAYQTAYLKAHHPACFFAAAMCYPKKKDDRMKLRRDMDAFGIPMLPPDINVSVARFVPELAEDGKLGVRFGLMAVEKTTAVVIDKIVERRGSRPFADLVDFDDRAGGLFNSAQLQHLAALGTFDGINPGGNRHQAYETLMFLAKNKPKDKGAPDMFGGAAKVVVRRSVLETPEWPNLSQRCRDAAGFHIVSHPLDAFESELADMGVRSKADMEAEGRASVDAAVTGYVHCMVDEVSVENSVRGQYLRLRVSDRNESFSINVYPSGKGKGGIERDFKLAFDLSRQAKLGNKPVVIKSSASYNSEKNRVFLNGYNISYADEFLDNGMEPVVFEVRYDLGKCVICASMGYADRQREVNASIAAGADRNAALGELMEFMKVVTTASFESFERIIESAITTGQVKPAEERDSSVIRFTFIVDAGGQPFKISLEPFKFLFKGGHAMYGLLQSLSGVTHLGMVKRYRDGEWQAPAPPGAGGGAPAGQARSSVHRFPARDVADGDGALPNWRRRPAAQPSTHAHPDEEPAPFSLH